MENINLEKWKDDRKIEKKISKSIYFRIKHLLWLEDYAEKNHMNLSQAFDLTLQRGIAYNAQMELQKQTEELKVNLLV